MRTEANETPKKPDAQAGVLTDGIEELGGEHGGADATEQEHEVPVSRRRLG